MQLALFDFDGTISDRDTTSDFIAHACGRRRALEGLVRLSPVLIAYGLKRISDHAAKAATITHYFGGWEKQAFIEAAQGYARQVVPRIIRPAARERIAWHARHGHTIAVVSGTLDILLADWCAGLGLDLIATGVDLDGARIGLSTRNCYGPEKARRIRERYVLEEFSHIYAYGDSPADSAMLHLAHERHYNTFKRKSCGG